MTAPDFDRTVEESHLALAKFVKGDPEPLKQMYSHRDDVSLANPFGPPVRGWRQAAETMERAASNYRDGEAEGFDGIAKFVSSDLACLVEIERYRTKVGGSADLTPVVVRVTSVFRREDGAWKIVHRHADPVTSARSAESVVQT
jgi:ketosteroid isomerase-like protein